MGVCAPPNPGGVDVLAAAAPATPRPIAVDADVFVADLRLSTSSASGRTATVAADVLITAAGPSGFSGHAAARDARRFELHLMREGAPARHRGDDFLCRLAPASPSDAETIFGLPAMLGR